MSTAVTPVWKSIEIPNKFDILPIHNSDRSQFKRCRRYWDWSSPTRTNLTPRADIHGVNPDLFFGTGIHYALEQWYQPGIKRDPVEAFKTWWNVQWRGGTVTEEWLPRVYDLAPKPVPYSTENMKDAGLISVDAIVGEGMSDHKSLWVVRGLEDILPDPDLDEWEELLTLGIHMLEHYKEYAAIHDDFEVIVAEHDFSVPIWDYEHDCILTARDLREDSPNWGKELEVHARGRNDAVYVKIATEKLGIHDYKTTTRWSEDELEKLETDEQATTYLWALEIEASYYDLPHKGKPIEEVLFSRLRKQYPKPPTMLKSGLFSIDRQNESTTYAMLTEWIARNIPGVPLSEKHQAYIDYLRDVGDEQFIIRKPARRNRHQLRNAGYRIYQEALDMLNPDLQIYPNLRNDWACLKCSFRAPCLAKEDGSDYEQLIADNYTINKDR